MGVLEKLFALDGALSAAACRWMCRHRRASAVLALLLNPTVPAVLALGSVRHTWPAYRDSMNTVVLDQTWQDAMRQLTDCEIPVVLAAGDQDDVADFDFYRALARRYDGLDVETVHGAGHLLPLTHPDRCMAHLHGLLGEPGSGARPWA